MLLHVDADAFFASVEQAADVRLRGLPVGVGGQHRGVITSASYEARKFGVTGAMPTTKARQLCPSLIVVPPHFDHYELFSRRLFEEARALTPMVEIGSIDEGYADLSGCPDGTPGEIARAFQQTIARCLKISVSVGVARNKLVAQIASKLRKPAGFIIVPLGQEAAFLHPLDPGCLPGVGPKYAATLHAAGFTTVGRIADASREHLGRIAGGGAASLQAMARGEDDRPVCPGHGSAKSYGTQDALGGDTANTEWMLARLRVMADALMVRVRRHGQSIRTVTVRVRHSDFSERQRSETLPEPVDGEHCIHPVIPRLLHRARDRRLRVRLLGLRFSHVYPAPASRELPLEGIPVSDERRHRLATTMDRLRASQLSVMRGHELWLREGARPRRQ